MMFSDQKFLYFDLDLGLDCRSILTIVEHTMDGTAENELGNHVSVSLDH